jgi:tRNA threonylcarbamoyladenosine biosynthesis protein TsaE
MSSTSELVVEIKTDSAEMTREVAKDISAILRPKDTVILTGDLGAGKTQFVKGVATALHVKDSVVSPTFIIGAIYEGDLKLIHIDAYRLDSLYEVLDLGLDDEFLDSICLIEWGNKIADFVENVFLTVVFGFGEVENERLLKVYCHDQNRLDDVKKVMVDGLYFSRKEKEISK